MKALFILMTSTLIASLAIMCAAIIELDVVTFGFSTFLSCISVLGACVSAGVLDKTK